jgi:hypothetical protein
MARPISGLKTNGVYVLLRPSEFIQSQVDNYADRWIAKTRIFVRLFIFYSLNLVLYAGPLTLAGFGTPLLNSPAPIGFRTIITPVYPPSEAWMFFMTLAQNSLYVLIISVLTLLTFHLGVWITRSSKGVLQSVHTFVFSTGIYLAMIFTLTWYVSTAGTIVAADEFLLYLQSEFVYYFIDLFGANLELPGGRQTPAELSALTQHGKLILAALLLSVLYYLYSLYLGARINHQASRFDSMITILVVLLSPVLYITGSILAFMLTTQLNIAVGT